MPEGKTVTGSRDDLTVDASRCLRVRFSESSCHLCVDVCPQRAVSIDGFLTVNPKHCSGCLLCTSVCPVGALEGSNDFPTCMEHLSKVPEAILGCVRTKERSNAAMSCLGGLSEEHLLALCHSLTGKVTLNLTLCNGCPNNLMLPHLRQRLAMLSAAGLLEGGCTLFLAESPQEIRYREESVNRRSFFKSLRNSLFQSAAVILSTTGEATERRTEYAGKRLPLRRTMLNKTRAIISQDSSFRISEHFDSTISFADTCTRCQGCVAICPTGALQTVDTDAPPVFEMPLCTGCGLCKEFCLDKGVQIGGIM